MTDGDRHAWRLRWIQTIAILTGSPLLVGIIYALLPGWGVRIGLDPLTVQDAILCLSTPLLFLASGVGILRMPLSGNR